MIRIVRRPNNLTAQRDLSRLNDVPPLAASVPAKFAKIEI